jgi:hypothetical protein
MRINFAIASSEHRVAGIDYFSWNSSPGSKQPDADSVFRCGALTNAGRLAIAPMQTSAIRK